MISSTPMLPPFVLWFFFFFFLQQFQKEFFYFFICFSPSKVLVCAPSNVAVDHLTEKIALTGLKVCHFGLNWRILYRYLSWIALEFTFYFEPEVDVKWMYYMLYSIACTSNSSGGASYCAFTRNYCVINRTHHTPQPSHGWGCTFSFIFN